jgi:hypothetical protein
MKTDLKVSIFGKELHTYYTVLLLSINDAAYRYKVISPTFIKRFEKLLTHNKGKALAYLKKVGERV